MSTATFAAGCFWGIESEFRRTDGVTATTVGYTGGHVENPTYRMVCGHRTGHAEAVRVEFDPDQVSYEQLLELFWTIHKPTTRNRQGLNIGNQYRSAIFFHDESQRSAAELSKTEAQARFRRKIVTEIVPAPEFYPAEDYHQRYQEKRGLGSCNAVLRAKVESSRPEARRSST